MGDGIEAVMEVAREKVLAGDAAGVVEMLGREEAKVAGEVYLDLQRELYWKLKDVRALVAISQAGIQWGMRGGERKVAMVLAYSLASFLWVGWEEKGIELSRAESVMGLEAGRLNLKLAEEMGSPGKVKGNSCWAIGVQQMALGDFAAAVGTFRRGVAFADGERVLGLMLEAYARLAELMVGGSEGRFEDGVTALRAEGSEDGREYAEQILGVRGVFERRKHETQITKHET